MFYHESTVLKDRLKALTSGKIPFGSVRPSSACAECSLPWFLWDVWSLLCSDPYLQMAPHVVVWGSSLCPDGSLEERQETWEAQTVPAAAQADLSL